VGPLGDCALENPRKERVFAWPEIWMVAVLVHVVSWFSGASQRQRALPMEVRESGAYVFVLRRLWFRGCWPKCHTYLLGGSSSYNRGICRPHPHHSRAAPRWWRFLRPYK
jgi:hypothetical protein